ncbi:hypothetical protein KUL25_06905 [Rhodobacteraceae bacterium N5(2021)]|uniref:Uncharacterized protein n=1 Tax=Gymnodinialimonas phycosphaerae TaxID=2841589 RepID=A0A975TYT1_9RHOB|nr:hypothetical protein [Gymnodinialimonas phycosphaerae]MBY4892489.1 hypothetical protein [Gymnodinialimonas phycosphaerae]
MGIYSDANISYSDTVQGVVSLTSARQVNAAVGRLDFVSSTVADLTGVFAGGFSSASLAPALNNTGGTMTNEFYFGVFACLNSSCTGTSGAGQRFPLTGTLVGTPVSAAIPLPASALLLLGGTGVARRRAA